MKVGVSKSPLIDLEGQQWPTGRKAVCHRERLSEGTVGESIADRCDSLDSAITVRKAERVIRSGHSANENWSSKVTDRTIRRLTKLAYVGTSSACKEHDLPSKTFCYYTESKEFGRSQMLLFLRSIAGRCGLTVNLQLSRIYSSFCQAILFSVSKRTCLALVLRACDFYSDPSTRKHVNRSAQGLSPLMTFFGRKVYCNGCN